METFLMEETIGKRDFKQLKRMINDDHPFFLSSFFFLLLYT